MDNVILCVYITDTGGWQLAVILFQTAVHYSYISCVE